MYLPEINKQRNVEQNRKHHTINTTIIFYRLKLLLSGLEYSNLSKPSFPLPKSKEKFVQYNRKHTVRIWKKKTISVKRTYRTCDGVLFWQYHTYTTTSHTYAWNGNRIRCNNEDLKSNNEDLENNNEPGERHRAERICDKTPAVRQAWQASQLCDAKASASSTIIVTNPQ